MSQPLELQPSDIYLSPRKSILRLHEIVAKHGVEEALTSNTFKQIREAWVAGVFLTGASRRTGDEYWLKSNPDPKDTPDVLVVSLRNSRPGDRGVIQEKVGIEVCEYEEHSDGDLGEFIERKLRLKAYPTWYSLVCYVRKPPPPTRIIDLRQEVENVVKQVGQIWVLYRVEDTAPRTYKAVRLLPEPSDELDCSLADPPNPDQRDLIVTERGPAKELNYQDHGPFTIALPTGEH